jgi:DMSO/TMAO reductase YedYZ molybdopterin-dependent catalytic subunit
MTTAFPGKGPMILQRMRPPLLETPLSVFDGDVFTPNDRFFVRWHWADIPTTVDVNAFRLAVRGEVAKPLSLTLADILRLPRFEIAAINQCSGNSRGLFQPRVPGAQWAHGAMGNALWTGVRLRDVLDLAGVRPVRWRCASAPWTSRWCPKPRISPNRSTSTTRAMVK